MVDVPTEAALGPNEENSTVGGEEEPAQEPAQEPPALPGREDVATKAVLGRPQKVKGWTFRVSRNSSEVRWGLTVDVLCQHGLVANVSKTGAVAEANATAPFGEDIRPGDLISSVNNCAGVAAMQEVLKSDACELDFALTRPRVRQIQVELKEGMHFGVRLGCAEKGIQVQEIKPDGVVAAHNKSAGPDESILVGDIIYGMKPSQSSTENIVAILRRVGRDAEFSSGELTFHIMRPPTKDV